ncbi:MAG TPA: cyclopropane fatty acyl phospholipid synthase [Candidatus Paceibacterota bacterium]|nr:cyclopropane fatty acyl phospholipid synthase [Candidatus Paceibacterota bacterium]
MSPARIAAERLLGKAGITINGTAPGDLVVHDERLFKRVIGGGTLALGEAYMDGWWDSTDLAEFFAKVSGANLDKENYSLRDKLVFLRAWLFNLQSRSRAYQVAHEHYDLGNDLYEATLDPRMIYTCAYWSGTPRATNLAEAQDAKLDLICRKLGLKAGDRVLDIGCGWGGFAKYAAEKYGAHVVGVTVSKEQLALAQERCKGLPIELRLQDYRDVNELFDHVVSIEMIEAVGHKNLREYFEVVACCLKPGGLFLLQAIVNQEAVTTGGDAWIDRYIFPNGELVSVEQLGKASERLLMMEDLHNFGADYDRTLVEWFKNFDAAWPSLKGKYGERFYRMWKYYLLQCAGLFRSRFISDVQVVFSKGGVPGGYQTVR